MDDACQGCLRSREEPEGEVRVDRLVIQCSVDESGREQTLELRGKDEEVAGASVIERLDAKSVACDQRPATPPVPDGEPKLAMHSLRTRSPTSS